MFYLILRVVKYLSYQVAYQNANDSTAGVDGSKGFPQEIRKDLLDIDGRDGSIEGIENSKTEPADDERLERRDDRESALDESGKEKQIVAVSSLGQRYFLETMRKK